MSVADSIYRLPSPGEVNDVPLVQSQFLGRLMLSRQRLLEQIFSYTMRNEALTENYNYLIMKN